MTTVEGLTAKASTVVGIVVVVVSVVSSSLTTYFALAAKMDLLNERMATMQTRLERLEDRSASHERLLADLLVTLRVKGVIQ